MPEATGKQLRPFRVSTRQRMRQFDTQPVTIGSQTSSDLPKVGFISGIILTVSATATFTGAGVMRPGYPFNLLKRIRVATNNAAATIADMSGFGCNLMMVQALRSGFNPTLSSLFQAGTANGANNWFFTYYVPISMNWGQQFELGLINLQAREIQMTLDLTFTNALADIATNLTSLTGNVSATYVYYDLPDPNTVQYPAPMIHRILEERRPVTSTGDQVYEVPRGGHLLQLVSNVTVNGNNLVLAKGFAGQSDLIDRLKLVINKTDFVYDISGDAANFINTFETGIWGGVPAMNFLDAGPTMIGEGDFRDTLDSDAISTLEWIITINSGATIISTDHIDHIRRVVQLLR